MSPLYDKYPVFVSVTAAIAIFAALVSILYYLKLFLHFLWYETDLNDLDNVNDTRSAIYSARGYQSWEPLEKHDIRYSDKMTSVADSEKGLLC
jgi:hypothetical protein